jgi:aspartate racemase
MGDSSKSSQRGRIGIIAGSGPEPGIDLWEKNFEEDRAAFDGSFRGDLDALHVVVHSIPGVGLSMGD